MKTLFRGHFITGSEDSKSKSEFEWCLDKIGEKLTKNENTVVLSSK